MKKSNIVLNRVGENGTIQIFEEIGNDWWYGYSLQQLMYDLQDVTNVDVQINSIGGNYFEALSIGNYLKLKGANTSVIGMAASAATVILYAGKKCSMPKNAWIMIHNPTVWNDGDADSMQNTADFLLKITDQLVSIYYNQILKNGKTQSTEEEEKKRIAEMMKAETWLNGEQAFEMGLIDELTDADVAIENNASIVMNNLIKNVKCKLTHTPTIINNNLEIQKNKDMDILAKIGELLKEKEPKASADLTNEQMIERLKASGFVVTNEALPPIDTPPAVVVEEKPIDTPPAVVDSFDETVANAVAKIIAGAVQTNAASVSNAAIDDAAKAKAEFAKGFTSLAAKLSI